MNILDEVKSLMKKQNITINDLVERTGIKRSTLYYIFENEDNFLKTKVENLFAIMDAMEGENKKTFFNILNEGTIEKRVKENPHLKFFMQRNIVCLSRLSEQDFEVLSLMIESLYLAKQKDDFGTEENTDK